MNGRDVLNITWPFVVAWLLFSLLCLTIDRAGAHVPERPELNEWFDHLASGKGLCCSSADGQTLDDPDWGTQGNHYRVRIEGQWIDVPDEAVITEPNKLGRTMVWPTHNDGEIGVRCFMPGSGM